VFSELNFYEHSKVINKAKTSSLASWESGVDSGWANTTNVISKQCLMKELTTFVAIMPMFVSDNGKLLESTNTFDRRPKVTKRQRF